MDAAPGGRRGHPALADTAYSPPQIAVLSPGTQTTVQDWPGRLGFRHVGVPPSGPMDDRSLRLANRPVGNPEGAAGLKIVVSGPSLRFDCDAVVCLSGGRCQRRLEAAGDRVAADQPLLVLEAMKAEITVAALRCRGGAAVAMGQRLPDLA